MVVVYLQPMNPMAPMSEHERRTVTVLCARIAGEKNPVIFRQLLIELDTLLEKLTVIRQSARDLKARILQPKTVRL